MRKVGIGIPIYKDLENLKAIVDILKNTPDLGIDFYILDHGSNDLELTKYLSTLSLPNVRVLSTKENFGFGGGVKYLIKSMNNPFVGWMPGNGKVNPADLASIPSLLSDDRAVIAFKANRQNRVLSENLKTFLAGSVISLWHGASLLDSGGTPTIVRKDHTQYLFSGPDDYSFEAFSMFTIRRLGIKLVRSKVPYGTRSHGVSHWQRGFKSEIRLLVRILSQKKSWKELVSNLPKL